MPITELLEKNAQMYGDEVSLVEINPKATEYGFFPVCTVDGQ